MTERTSGLGAASGVIGNGQAAPTVPRRRSPWWRASCLPPLIAILMVGSPAPATAARIDDGAAIAIAEPQELIVDKSLSPTQLAAMLKPVRAFYGFWNGGTEALLDAAISPNFFDHELPIGRPQGPRGPVVGLKGFLGAVPDLRITVIQRIVVGDRVTSLLHCTGHFTGRYGDLVGKGQTVDFISVDILRVRGGRITDNWHLEDNLAFLKQIGAIK